MASIANSLPIEVAVMQAYAQVENDATKTLRDKIGDVDENMQAKDKIRKAQEALAELKGAIDAGDQGAIDRAKSKIRAALGDAGVPENSAAMEAAAAGVGPTTEWTRHETRNDDGSYRVEYKNETKHVRQPHIATSNMSDENRDALESWYEQLKTAIDGEAQARSDIGQKLQFELNEANNIYTRMTKARSDMSSKYDQSLKGIAQNIKG